MSTFNFIIPLIAKKTSADWELTQRLLEGCLCSLQEQSARNWRVIVVGHDEPECIQKVGSKFSFIRADWEAVSACDDVKRKRIDRRKKLELGVRDLRDLSDFVMFLDADDHLHKDFVKRASEHVSADAILCNGFEFDLSERKAVLRSNLHDICSSTFIFRRHIIDFHPVGEYCGRSEFFSYSHKNYLKFFEKKKIHFSHLDFPAVIYVTGNVTSIAMHKFRTGTFKRRLFRRIRFLIQGLSPERICNNFPSIARVARLQA